MLNWIASRELSPSLFLRFYTGWADFILLHNCIFCRFTVRFCGYECSIPHRRYPISPLGCLILLQGERHECRDRTHTGT